MTVAKLSLTAAVVVAVALVTAGSALAAEFEAGGYTTTISGESTTTQTFALGTEGEVKCKKATFAGELPEPSESMGVVPTYSECTAFGMAATVNSGGCQLVYKPTTETKEAAFTGEPDISCPKEQHVTITAVVNTCEIQIGSQNSLSHAITTENLASEPPNLTAELTLSGVHANVTKDLAFCPLMGTGERTNGTMTGSSLLKGSIEGEPLGLAVAAGKSKLCKKPPEAGAKCPAGQVYEAATNIAAVAKFPAQPKSNLTLVEALVIKDAVICEQGTVSMRTKEKEGAPLKVESFLITFASCKTTIKGTACTVQMVNGPLDTTLTASKELNPGDGIILSRVTLFFECGAEYKCQYSAPRPEIWLFGGEIASVLTGFAKPGFKREVIAGEVGCPGALNYYGSYTVAEPKLLWFTR